MKSMRPAPMWSTSSSQREPDERSEARLPNFSSLMVSMSMACHPAFRRISPRLPGRANVPENKWTAVGRVLSVCKARPASDCGSSGGSFVIGDGVATARPWASEF